MNLCLHCGSNQLKCLKTSISVVIQPENRVGVHGDLYGCKTCGKLTVHGISAIEGWDNSYDAIPDILELKMNEKGRFSFGVFKLNPTYSMKKHMERWNPEWTY